MRISSRLIIVAAINVALCSSADFVSAAKRLPSARSEKAPLAQVELFDAMGKGDIEVTFIPKDATSATILFRNKTKKPLSVKLPEAFAGVPIHRQFGGGMGGGMGGMGGGMGGGGGGGQAMGGGMGGGGMGGGGMGGGMGGMGGGFFNVAPDRVGKLKVATVCLEHGRPDPTPRMKYKIIPIEMVSKKKDVVEVCKMLGYGKLPQNVAQAATWHLANGLSWQELAHKDRVKLSNGYTEKWFYPQELQLAVRVVNYAVEQAKKQPVVSPGDSKSDSLSQR